MQRISVGYHLSTGTSTTNRQSPSESTRFLALELRTHPLPEESLFPKRSVRCRGISLSRKRPFAAQRFSSPEGVNLPRERERSHANCLLVSRSDPSLPKRSFSDPGRVARRF